MPVPEKSGNLLKAPHIYIYIISMKKLKKKDCVLSTFIQSQFCKHLVVKKTTNKIQNTDIF